MHSTVGGGSTDRVTLPALDSMRAVAAVAVLATHAAYWGGDYREPVWGTALARLDIGVAVFFVLSGFLLSRAWFARQARGLPRPSAQGYLWRRALRIVPVYVLAVLAAYLLLPDNRDASPGEWLTSLLMLDLYVDDNLPAGLTQMWSLGTEVAFYLTLPLLMWFATASRTSSTDDNGVRRLVLVVTVLAALNVAWILDLSDRLDPGGTMIQLWLPAYLTWFCVGMVMAHAHVHREDSRSGRALVQMGAYPGACWTAALSLFVVACSPVAGPYDLVPATLGEAMTKNLLYATVAGLVILPAAFAPPHSRYVTVLSLPALRHAGHLSYGVFCFHLVVLELVADWRDIELFRGRGLELFGITLVLTLLVCEVVYRLVERPALRLKDVGPGRPGSTATTAATVTSASS
ncbi:MAG: hypothetical protein AVDCRST_MAG47-2348 [uncultured Nocardioidaceae bacterium]|uniref:Acyltransferase 3 domain-containing protein n=1 Tax=uncultured Nocardioidaceae bacterium TaxID=253824 RepID=A0A6J4NFA4_9ACTN|nr:MAG: hypothetical protein AVDCRST_MAG47-2348 [uncultured Nocardioidaceae bacterium]